MEYEFPLSIGKVVGWVSLYLPLNRHLHASLKMSLTSQYLHHAWAMGMYVRIMLLGCYNDGCRLVDMSQ